MAGVGSIMVAVFSFAIIATIIFGASSTIITSNNGTTIDASYMPDYGSQGSIDKINGITSQSPGQSSAETGGSSSSITQTFQGVKALWSFGSSVFSVKDTLQTVTGNSTQESAASVLNIDARWGILLIAIVMLIIALVLIGAFLNNPVI